MDRTHHFTELKCTFLMCSIGTNWPNIFSPLLSIQEMFTIKIRGGSRTSPRRGRQSLGEGRLPNILVIFSENPYEIIEILVRREGRPPKSATESMHASKRKIDFFSEQTDKIDKLVKPTYGDYKFFQQR